MKNGVYILLMGLLFLSCSDKEEIVKPFTGEFLSGQNQLVIHDINLVEIDEQKIVPHQSVFIKNGQISSIGHSKDFVIPEGAKTIEGGGQYLMPGLADMHTHLGLELDTASQIGRLEMLQYLSNGVTTILNLGDFLPENNNPLLKLKKDVEKNKEIGPTLYCALYAREPGNGRPHQFVDTYESGVAFVRKVVQSGYDFIKIYTFTPERAVQGIFNEAKKKNIGIVGHLSRPVKLSELVSENGVDLIAHTTEILYTFCNAKGDDYGTTPNDVSFEVNRDTLLFEKIAGQLTASNIYLTPTLYINNVSTSFFKGNLSEYKAYFGRRGNQNTHPLMQKVWQQRFMGVVNPFFSKEIAEANNLYEKQMLKYFADHGVAVMLGTDSEFAFGAAGYSAYNEILEMAKAGLSNAQILRSATSIPGEFIRQFKKTEIPFGKIEKGYRADLLISKVNPLKNIDSLQYFEAVIARGNYYKKGYLQYLEDSISRFEHQRFNKSLLDKSIRIAFSDQKESLLDSLRQLDLKDYIEDEKELDAVKNAFKHVEREDVIEAFDKYIKENGGFKLPKNTSEKGG